MNYKDLIVCLACGATIALANPAVKDRICEKCKPTDTDHSQEKNYSPDYIGSSYITNVSASGVSLGINRPNIPGLGDWWPS